MKKIYLILVGIIISAVAIKAQDYNENNPFNLSQLGIQNYVEGLNSSNDGLKRSCIIQLGQYKIKEAVVPLMNMLDEEKIAENRTLIAMALYNIGDKKGIEKIKEHSFADVDIEVRRICNTIVAGYNEPGDVDKISVVEY